MRKLTIHIPNEIAEVLDMTAVDINARYSDHWTAETLAASFLKHMIEDDAEAEIAFLHLTKQDN